jgi:prokaryotic ubiquitin-like protein Pup
MRPGGEHVSGTGRIGEQPSLPPRRSDEGLDQARVTPPVPRELLDDVDALLDEIDEVLEENADEFVRGYVQKGGQ